MEVHCLVPARLGSNRLKEKNLLQINGVSLVKIALLKCLKADIFDTVVLNSDSELILKEADGLPVKQYKRKSDLGSSTSTSEDYIQDYFANSTCDVLVQVHSIAPLLNVNTILEFFDYYKSKNIDTLISCNDEWLEYLYEDSPLNFNFIRKENSQDLKQLKKVNWAISAWKRKTFLDGYMQENVCGTYSGKVEFYSINSKEALMIKEENDYLFSKFVLENDS